MKHIFNVIKHFHKLIKNILIRRKESDTYLATVRRPRSLQVAMKEDKMCSFQPALWPSSAEDEGHSAG